MASLPLVSARRLPRLVGLVFLGWVMLTGTSIGSAAVWTPVFETPGDEIVRVLSSPSENTCWFITNFDRIYKTSNGGATWSSITTGAFVPSGLFVVDDQVAFKIGTAAVYRTTNGGTSFQLVYSPGGSATPEVWMLDAVSGFVAYNGVLRKTINGGTTWTTTGVTQPPLPIMGSRGKGSLWSDGAGLWVALQNSGIAYSPDLGATWTVPQNDGLLINRAPVISFASSGFGAMIMHSAVEVRVTTDGGNHWNVTDTTFGDNEDVLAMGSHAWFIPNPGDHSYVRYSSDMGATWETQLTDESGFAVLTRSRIGHRVWTGTALGRIWRYDDEESASTPDVTRPPTTLLAFPNPCRDSFELQGLGAYPQGDALGYRIVTPTGAIVLRGSLDGSDHGPAGRIDASPLASGCYLVEIRGQDTRRIGSARILKR